MTDHTTQSVRSSAPPSTIAKVCGSDVELGNFITGQHIASNWGTASEASRLLLRQFEGFDRGGWSGNTYWQHSQDWGAEFLPSNGGCVYIDLNHLEICTPECVSAFDHVSAFQAMLRLTRQAMDRANGEMREGQHIRVTVNNSDGENSWGSHLNFLLTRRAYENIFTRKPHMLLFLAAYQVSSIIFTGAGAVGAANDQPACDYRISSRGDYYEQIFGIQTTMNRPLVNTRDEGLTGSTAGGPGGNLARLHCIFFDSGLAPVASVLKVGPMQIILAMIEQEQVPVDLLLDDPLEALSVWNRDPGLGAVASLANGRQLTAVEHAGAVFERARDFVAAGRAEGIVPEAARIIDLWGDTLAKLAKRDFQSLRGRCDWVLKHWLLGRAAQSRRLQWDDPQMKMLDLLYASLDEEEGLFWACQKSGLVEQVTDERQVRRFMEEPPEDTRAWARAHILRRSDGVISDVDWDKIECRLADVQYRSWTSYRQATLEMGNPLHFTRKQCQTVLEGSASLLEAMDALGLRRQDRWGASSSSALVKSSSSGTYDTSASWHGSSGYQND